MDQSLQREWGRRAAKSQAVSLTAVRMRLLRRSRMQYWHCAGSILHGERGSLRRG
jgi:hypothetical protein